MRVAVIGAGAAGLAAARELRREGHAPVVFERGGGVGGTWIYDEPRDREGGGHYHHSSLYASLRTNLPREVMGFLDFPFAAAALPESVDPRRFPRHEEVLRYIQEFARRFELYDLVRFRTEVTAMTAAAGGSVKNQMSQSHGGGGGCWRVRWRKLFVADDADAADAEEEEGEEPFDAVVVCNGHYTEPRIADIPGIDAWPGKQMHSRSYRVPDPFVDQRLPGHHNLWLHSMVSRATADGAVVFRDGTSVKADVIMHCTGYKYSFPFLSGGGGGDDSAAVVSVHNNRIHPLYKHVFVPRLAPRLAFIGLPFKVIPFPLAQLQASWVAGALSGRIRLPSEEEMMEEVGALYSEMEAAGWPVRYTHCLKHSQFEYDEWLAEQCGHAGVEEWRKEMYDAASKKKADCPETYREQWDDHHLLEQAYHDFQKYIL